MVSQPRVRGEKKARAAFATRAFFSFISVSVAVKVKGVRDADLRARAEYFWPAAERWALRIIGCGYDPHPTS